MKMNGILKAASGFSSYKYLLNPVKRSCGVLNANTRQFTRTLWYMRSGGSTDGTGLLANYKQTPHSNLCSCGCGMQRLHTKGEKELVEFLTEEIANERKAQKLKTIPTEIDGFKVKLDESEVTMTKKLGDEEIEVNFNINHTVDADTEPEVNPNMDKPEFGEMKSKPTFEVDIRRGSKTLGFTCSFTSGQQDSEEGYNDIFAIDEVTLYEGEWSEKTYAVSGEILDGYLYDLLMTLLEEKGISNEFVEKLSEFSTAYEHNTYIAFLESLQKFSCGK
ncbi:complement component 1 Q subcomponent-binding protein, mitochondrial [Schistocerca nitens]|uniref:complement component 1 Q subcomponent-binding protein, mitochondrial n=1 Tax=Schistocerca nitens TaxID=7011 RepID=UPI00211868AA|nr:complement component 1 Q subcomponent-binding protein, mitochondrial [Schistocerca nitens]